MSGIDVPLSLVNKQEETPSPLSSISPSPGSGRRARSRSRSPIRPLPAERSVSRSPLLRTKMVEERPRSPPKAFERPVERPGSRSSQKPEERPHSRSSYKPEDRSHSMSSFKHEDRPHSRSSPRDERNKSSPDPKHLCKVCRKTFSSSSSVHIHMWVSFLKSIFTRACQYFHIHYYSLLWWFHLWTGGRIRGTNHSNARFAGRRLPQKEISRYGFTLLGMLPAKESFSLRNCCSLFY
jgi:hypothetical protein